MKRPHDTRTSGAAGSGFATCQGVPRGRLVAVAVGAAVLLGLWWLAPTRYWISAAVDWLDDGRASAVVVFTAAYAVLAVLGVPTTLFVIAAGVLFGTGAGFASAQTGAITAAALSFLISRHVARDWVRINLMCRRRSRALLEVMDDEGWKMVVVTRLNPLLPASIKNYGFGLTRIRFGAYLLATLAVQAPVLLLYTYLGSMGKLSLQSEGGPKDWTEYLFYGAGAVAAVVHVVLVTWYTRRKLRRAADSEGPTDASTAGA